MKYLILLSITGLLFSCTSNKQVEDSQTLNLPAITLQKDSITLYTEFPARIEGKVNVNIRSQIGDDIQEIFVEEGAYVKAGQSLFKIDDRSYVEQVNTTNANLNLTEKI